MHFLAISMSLFEKLFLHISNPIDYELDINFGVVSDFSIYKQTSLKRFKKIFYIKILLLL